MSSKLSTSNSQFVSFQQVLQFSLPPKKNKKDKQQAFCGTREPSWLFSSLHPSWGLGYKMYSSGKACSLHLRRSLFAAISATASCLWICQWSEADCGKAAWTNQMHGKSLLLCCLEHLLSRHRGSALYYSPSSRHLNPTSTKRMHKRHNTKPISEKGATIQTLSQQVTQEVQGGGAWRTATFI